MWLKVQLKYVALPFKNKCITEMEPLLIFSKKIFVFLAVHRACSRVHQYLRPVLARNASAATQTSQYMYIIQYPSWVVA